MTAERPSQPFDIRDLNLDVEVEADTYDDPLPCPETLSPETPDPDALLGGKP